MTQRDSPKLTPDAFVLADNVLSHPDEIAGYLTAAQSGAVFQQIFDSLAYGGLLVVDVPMRSETELPSEAVSLLHVALGAISGGAVYSFADYSGWLQHAGFRQVRQLGEHWLSASKE